MCVPIYLQGSARVPAPASLWSEPSEIRDVIIMLPARIFLTSFQGAVDLGFSRSNRVTFRLFSSLPYQWHHRGR